MKMTWKSVQDVDGSVRMIQVPAEEEKPVVNVVEKSCSCGGTCGGRWVSIAEDARSDEEEFDEAEEFLDEFEEEWDDEEDEESSDKAYTFEDIFSMDKYITFINERTAEYLSCGDEDCTVVLHAGEILIVNEGDVDIRRLDDEVTDDLFPWDWEDVIE